MIDLLLDNFLHILFYYNTDYKFVTKKILTILTPPALPFINMFADARTWFYRSKYAIIVLKGPLFSKAGSGKDGFAYGKKNSISHWRLPRYRKGNRSKICKKRI